MKRIELSKITVEDGKILYEVRQDSGVELLRQDLAQLFIRLHCAENVKVSLGQVPQSILAVPISLYLLPLTYFYKIELVLPVMDKSLYDNLPEIYAAYSKLYGAFDEEWRGKVTVKTIIETPSLEKSMYDRVVFFSGGVDACSAGINNSGRKTLLVSIPDIEIYAKNEGPLREEKFSMINKFSEVVNSDWVLISNNFNATLFRDNEIGSYLKTQKRLCGPAVDGWLGIKYLANMCCVAPLAYALGIKRLIMGSGFGFIEGKERLNNDGAHPLLTNSISFAGIGFSEQDGSHTRRSTKVRNIIEWCNSRHKKVKLWTCFCDESSQCGVCHKCVRTQLNILATRENPRDWGFAKFDESKFEHLMRSYQYYENDPCWLWDIIDVIDEKIMYPYCNRMLHWLKHIGYKEYFRRAKSQIEWHNRIGKWRNRICKLIGVLQKIFLIQKYPHYLKRIICRLKNA